MEDVPIEQNAFLSRESEFNELAAGMFNELNQPLNKMVGWNDYISRCLNTGFYKNIFSKELQMIAIKLSLAVKDIK